MKPSKPLQRRTPMPRGQGFQRKEPKPKAIRPKKCKCGCGAEYMPNPAKPFINWATDDCAVKLAQAKLVKMKAKARREEAAGDRAKREKNKTKGQLIAEAQQVFNSLVRFLDADEPCISCGTMNPKQRGVTGGVWDAGHYHSRGAAPHLRFDRRNVHKQCKGCNRPGGCSRAQFTAGMLERIGPQALAELDAAANDTTPVKWTHDDLRAMRDGWRRELAALKKERKA